MLFSALIKFDNHYKSSCDLISVTSSEHLLELESQAMQIISDNSLAWFKKTLGLKQVASRFTTTVWSPGMQIQGLIFHAKSCQFDTIIEDSFFNVDIEDTPTAVPAPVSEVSEVPEVPELEPTKVEESFSLSNMLSGIGLGSGESSEVQEAEEKKRKYLPTLIKNLKDKLKEAIEKSDMDNAYKISKVLKNIQSSVN